MSEGSTALFNYSPAQRYNIHMKLHPDCGLSDTCSFCGASEASGVCRGDLSGLVLDLFQEASCSVHNANIKSIGQATNWAVHNRQAKAFDAAARALSNHSAQEG